MARVVAVRGHQLGPVGALRARAHRPLALGGEVAQERPRRRPGGEPLDLGAQLDAGVVGEDDLVVRDAAGSRAIPISSRSSEPAIAVPWTPLPTCTRRTIPSCARRRAASLPCGW